MFLFKILGLLGGGGANDKRFRQLPLKDSQPYCTVEVGLLTASSTGRFSPGK